MDYFASELITSSSNISSHSIGNYSAYNLTYGNSTATPVPPPLWWSTLYVVFKYSTRAALTIVMFCMGCGVPAKDLQRHIRRPSGIAVGAVTQFGLMPLFSFAMGHALRLSPYTAMGVLIWGCSPSGALSNMFTYWSKGDLPLSICLTTVDTALALAFMPLNLFIYSRSWISQTTAIPYVNIVLTLVGIVVPTSLGILLRWWKPHIGQRILKVGSMFSLGLILVCVAFYFTLYGPRMILISWRIWLASFLLPIIGYASGFTLSRIARFSYSICRTVALETGSQNIPVAIVVIMNTFSPAAAGQALMAPLLASLFIFVDSGLFVGAFWLQQKCFKVKDGTKRNDGDVVSQNDALYPLRNSELNGKAILS